MHVRVTPFRRSSIEQLEARTLFAFSGQVVAYVPDYETTPTNLQFNSQIDYTALTRINYFSIIPASNGSLPGSTSSGHSFTELQTVVSLAHAKGVAVSITIDPAAPFQWFADHPTDGASFITNILSFCGTYHLDGIDMDYEPGTLTGAQMNSWGSFLTTLHAQTQSHGLVLTAAVQAGQQIIPIAYIGALDWYYLMDYDLQFNDSAPLADSKTYLTNWVNYGVPKSKLLMGVPFYGRAGTSWSNSTTLSYAAILNGYYSTHSNTYPGPGINSVTIGSKTYGFNGITMMQTKAQYILQNGFAGMMIWELGQDHFTGTAYDSVSLLPTIKSAMTVTTPSWISSPWSADYTINGSALTVLGKATNDTVTLTADASASIASLNINVADGGKLKLAASQHVGNVSLNGTADLASYQLFTTNTATSLRASIQAGQLFTSTVGAVVGYRDMGAGILQARATLIGDADLNASVDVADLGALATNYGETTGATWAQGDFDYNGAVDVADLGALATQYGNSFAGGAASAASPTSATKAVLSPPAPLPTAPRELVFRSNEDSTPLPDWMWRDGKGTSGASDVIELLD